VQIGLALLALRGREASAIEQIHLLDQRRLARLAGAKKEDLDDIVLLLVLLESARERKIESEKI
jgi:hypothetical protein